MPTGPRIRANNVFGTVTNNPLTAGGISLTSAELALLPQVTSAHSVLTLDPLRSAGAPEIVVVTAHGAGATSATVLRGQYGTVARSHAAGVVWVHAPVEEDVVKIVTSSTRPSDPYEGQIIYERDTGKHVFRSAIAWVDFFPSGAIIMFGGASAPDGWFVCDGAAKSRTTYARLFAEIGTSYGPGDGSTTFNLPNYEDCMPLGKGTTFPTLGATGGSKDAVVVSHNHGQDFHNHGQDAHNHGQNAHGHGVNDPGHKHAADGDFGFRWAVTTGFSAHRLSNTGNDISLDFTDVDVSGTGVSIQNSTAGNQASTAGNQGTTATNQASGGSGTNANLPPYQVANFIIKV